MLGKRWVSGVFIGSVRASPRSDGGSKSEIRGYGGSKIHSAYPTLNVGYPRVKGAKDCPFEARVEAAESGTCTGTQDVPRGRKNPQYH